MITDVRALVLFRLDTITRGRLRLTIALVALVAVATGAVLLPLRARGLAPAQEADARLLLPAAFLGFAVTATLAAISSAGGRELIVRDNAVAYPVSPAVDHVGALMLSPLNLAWLLQALALLALTSYAVPAGSSLAAGLLVTAAWVTASTVVAQALSWGIEWLRSLPRGPWVVRGVGVLVVAVVVSVVSTGHTTAALHASATWRWGLAVLDGTDGRWLTWAAEVGELAALTGIGFGAGLVLATGLARRPRREESRSESRHWPRRSWPTSDALALLRGDRASVWRSVPLRRGAVILTVLPGTVAAIGRVPWETIPVLPGLVASGAALLFGVNAWCLDGQGAWWRASLPVRPRLVLAVRAVVLLETIALPMGVTLALAVLRAPTRASGAQVLALGCAAAVITTHVLARSLHWSVTAPHAADLRSARATPAPPAAMAGYSARLALMTTLTGIAFGVCGTTGRSDVTLALTAVLLVLSARRLVGVARRWDVPEVRATIVQTVTQHG